MKRLLSLLLCLTLALALCVPVLAAVYHDNVYTSVDGIDNDRLSVLGTSTLPDLASQLEFDLRVDIVTTTEDSSLEEYAAIFYDQYEYGYGDNRDGALLMILLTDNGGTVNFDGYTVHGGGRGAELLEGGGSSQLSDLLSASLSGSGYSYEEAGNRCADGIESFANCMAALNGQDVSVQTETPRTDVQSLENQNLLIRDNAGLLTDSQVQALEEKAEAISNQYGCNVYVLTEPSIGSMNRRDYAKQYYLDNNLGYGDWKNGILFLVAMESRDYVTVTYGRNPADPGEYGTGIYAFSDYGVEKLEDQVVPHLSDGDYDKAFNTYVDICGRYLKQYTETGEPYDVGQSGTGILIKLLITILVPLLIALIVCLIFWSQMNTAVAATQANDYIPADGFNLTRQIDQYTHTTQTRRSIERESHSGGSSVDSGGFGGSSGGKF